MVKLTLKRIPASSLLEVIVSMVIIMAVFVVALGIYTKVTQSGFSTSRVRAQSQMKKIVLESIENRHMEDASFTIDSIVYEKNVSSYAGYGDILQITIEAKQQGESLGILKQLVKQTNENQ